MALRRPTEAPPAAGRAHRLLLPDVTADLFAPSGDAAGARPLLVMLHGAGGQPDHALSLVRAQAARDGILVLAPKSRAQTWDVIRGGYGPDVRALDQAMAWVVDRFEVDPLRTAVGGFSDGASYALCLGLANGDRFSRVLAFSPGFAAPAVIVGAPRIYISHGRSDAVLPFSRCGESLARRLSAAGYGIEFQPFDGGHVVPEPCIEAGVRLLLA